MHITVYFRDLDLCSPVQGEVQNNMFRRNGGPWLPLDGAMNTIDGIMVSVDTADELVKWTGPEVLRRKMQEYDLPV